MDLIEKYKNYRQIQVQLHSKMMNEHVDGDQFLESARLLGILNNKDLVVIDSDAERDALSDFNIYGHIRGGKSTLTEFIHEYQPKSDVENKLLRSMAQSYVSLYEILEVHKEERIVIINDILHGGSNAVKLVDLNMSQIKNQNILFFTRLIKLEEFSITSGLAFSFSANHKEYIIRRSRKMLKKTKTGDDSTDIFMVFFDLNRSDGMPLLFEQV